MTIASAVRDARPAAAAPERRLDWLDPIKAFAILGILLNHFVEEFGPGPWFTNPSANWPALSTRLATLVPHDPSPFWRAVRLLGWLGDAAPGVFIFASGVGLTLSALQHPDRDRDRDRDRGAFYRRRLLRLYPLYIAMHVVVLAGALLVPGNTLSFGSPATLLSVAGLRFTRGLFFYISPAWWFVWLVLQLYLVYPLLLRGLNRLGPWRFFAVAVALTVVSRSVGLFLPSIRYYWLTGLFFGSRLAEFAAGMVVAWWLARGAHEPPVARVLPAAILCYIAGLAASCFLPTVVVSNLLVTLGMTGVFYAVARSTARAAPWQRLGAASYAIFLLHQPPLKWTAAWLGDHCTAHMLAAAGVLVLSWPIAVGIERAVRAIQRDGVATLRRVAAPLSWLSAAFVLPVLIAFEPQLTPDGRWQRALCWLLAVDAIALIWLEIADAGAPMARREARRAAALASLLALFVVPAGSGYLAAVIALVVAGAVGVADAMRARRPWLVGGLGAAAVLAAAELAAGRVAPREVGGWGERPALAIHPTRAFALIPNKVTHLRYNEYDYTVRTNSFGLASPEVPPVRADANTFRVLTMGDAFTMPEALPYEESYPALLQTALSRCLAPRPVEVINAGVTGYGPLEELPQFRELGPLFTPNVVVHEFFVNDWQDITIQADQRRRGIGLVGGGGTVRGSLRDRSQLAANLRGGYDAVVAAATGQPSADQAWKLMLPYFRRGDNAFYDSANMARMAQFVAAFRDQAQRIGAPLLLFYTPAGVSVLPRDQIAYLPRSGIPLSDREHYDMLRPYTALQHITDSLGVPLIDLAGPLTSHQPQPTYYPNAWHWTAEGHRAAAAAILGTLQTRGIIDRECAL